MKIVVIGTRGIPGIQGGVETHCEQLFPRLAAKGYDITIIRRTPYVNATNRIPEFRGVKLVDVYAPRKKAFEAIVHSVLAVFKAKRLGADILHIHAIGPSIVAPLARMMRMKVISTNHGPDYDRRKWGFLAKSMLKFGERMGAGFSNRVIVISTVIADILAKKYGRTDVNLIYNGVNPPMKSTSKDYITGLGLEPGKYVVALGRFVKEKGFDDLIKAFSQYRAANPESGLKLVIAGDADHEDNYSRELKKQATESGTVLTGFIKGAPLNELMSHAALFAMPSYHEGLPIALLEAMSYDIDVIVSDIPANRLDCLAEDDFFPVGDIDALAAKIAEKASRGLSSRTYDLTPYNWDTIADKTAALYDSLFPAH